MKKRNVSTQTHRGPIYLSFQSEFDENDSYTNYSIWMNKEIAEHIISLLQKSIDELGK